MPNHLAQALTSAEIMSVTMVKPEPLAEKWGQLQADGVATGNVWMDVRAHPRWPYHRLLDGADEGYCRRETEDGEAMGTGRFP
jgi:hypothetical protein